MFRETKSSGDIQDFNFQRHIFGKLFHIQRALMQFLFE
jgi:hypothetical protein